MILKSNWKVLSNLFDNYYSLDPTIMAKATSKLLRLIHLMGRFRLKGESPLEFSGGLFYWCNFSLDGLTSSNSIPRAIEALPNESVSRLAFPNP